MSDIDRTSRIAELLLLERELLKAERISAVFCASEYSKTFWDKYEAKGITFTPIEKVMHSILLRISDDLWFDGQEMIVSPQAQIGQYRVDFLVTNYGSEAGVIIECDGHDFHEKTKEQAKHDKERDRWLTSQGYKILRYTGSEIYNDFVKIEDELFDLLDVKKEKSLLRGE